MATFRKWLESDDKIFEHSIDKKRTFYENQKFVFIKNYKKRKNQLLDRDIMIRSLNIFDPWTISEVRLAVLFGITGPYGHPSQISPWSNIIPFFVKIDLFRWKNWPFLCENNQFWCESLILIVKLVIFVLKSTIFVVKLTICCKIDLKFLKRLHFETKIFIFMLKKYCNKLTYFQCHSKIDRKWSKIIKLLCRIWEVSF